MKKEFREAIEDALKETFRSPEHIKAYTSGHPMEMLQVWALLEIAKNLE